MPTAFALAHGLDWNTEIESFWAWFHDAQAVLEREGEANSLVRELVAGQKDRILSVAKEQKDPETGRLALTLAVALVGVQYSTAQKLLNALKDAGVDLNADKPQPEADLVAARARTP